MKAQSGTRDSAVGAAPGLVCAALEVALNRYLRLESSALEECARLAGRSVELRIAAPAWPLFIEFTAGGVRVASPAPAPPDVSVSAPLAALLRLGVAAAQGEPGLPAGLQVDGDAELLTRFSKLLSSVGFDLEEVLAKYIDGGAAHRLAGGLRELFGWGRKTADTLLLDTAEYLREETGDLARREDVEEWTEAVDTLREKTDRLEAKLARLEAKA